MTKWICENKFEKVSMDKYGLFGRYICLSFGLCDFHDLPHWNALHVMTFCFCWIEEYSFFREY